MSSSRRGTGPMAITLSLQDQSIERFQNTIEANLYFYWLKPLDKSADLWYNICGSVPKNHFEIPVSGP